MGEGTLIFVRREQAEDLYFTAEKINCLFGQRWYWFKNKFHLPDNYPERQSYWTPEQILGEIAGKKVSRDCVDIIEDLTGLDCIIQGSYMGFPKEKDTQDDYIELMGVFYRLWENIKYLKGEVTQISPLLG